MKKRLFFAINFSQNLKLELSKILQKFDLPVRFTALENLHLTLLFLGNIEEKNIPEILNAAQKALLDIPAFNLEFNKIVLSPGSRMIWLLGKQNRVLSSLYENLKKEISALNLKIKLDNRPYKAHATLARIKFPQRKEVFKKWKNLAFEKKLAVRSIELLESKLLKNGAKYKIIKKFPLK